MSSEEQLIDLQTRLAFQEDTLLALEHTVAAQHRELTLLRKQLAELSGRWEDLARNHPPAAPEPPPPHY